MFQKQSPSLYWWIRAFHRREVILGFFFPRNCDFAHFYAGNTWRTNIFGVWLEITLRWSMLLYLVNWYLFSSLFLFVLLKKKERKNAIMERLMWHQHGRVTTTHIEKGRKITMIVKLAKKKRRIRGKKDEESTSDTTSYNPIIKF